MSASEILHGMTDEELMIVVSELDDRYELFSAQVRMQVNDELRRRRLSPVRRMRYA